MTIQTWCIGTPGQCPRVFITADEDYAQAQTKDGEVCFYQANYVAPPFAISADGAALVATTTPLDDLKTAKWIEARNYRDVRAFAGCTTPSGHVDTDNNAKLNISGAASAAAIAKAAGEAFSLDWTMSDNSVVAMDADAMIAVGMAVVLYLNNVQAAGTTIRNQIDAAIDEDALNAIDITAGYPA